MNPANQAEDIFRLALNLRRETDPARFDTYFFDASTVYVYVSQAGSPLSFVSNLVHEIGHSLLANSPLGFVHQSLFELAAIASGYLWHHRIEPVLKANLAHGVDTEAHLQSLNDLSERGPRDRATRKNIRQKADLLWEASLPELKQALREERDLIAALLALEQRRTQLMDASRLCHEAIATFMQCGPNALARYRSLIELFISPSERAPLYAHIADEITAQQRKLTGVWQAGYEQAQRIYQATGTEESVLLAGHVAHHFPYHACRLLDLPSADFEHWRDSLRLNADLRFQYLASHPDLLKEEATLCGFLTREPLPPLSLDSRSFQHWHQQEIIQSKLARPILNCLPRLGNFSPEWVADDWTERLMSRPTGLIVPPVIFEDGRVMAPTEAIATLIKHDFVRATRLKSVLRTLARCQSQ